MFRKDKFPAIRRETRNVVSMRDMRELVARGSRRGRRAASYTCLLRVGIGLDSFTVSLHTPNGRNLPLTVEETRGGKVEVNLWKFQMIIKHCSLA